MNLLSLGKNQIKALEDSIQYLKSLKCNLEVLKVADNEFCENKDKDYKKYTIAYLKNLKYLDYELIEDKEREVAQDEHKEEMADVENKEENEKKDKGGESEVIDEILVETHIGCTVKILSRVVNETDEELHVLKSFDKYTDIFNNCDGQIEDLTNRYHSEMKSRFKKKKEIIEFCLAKMCD